MDKPSVAIVGAGPSGLAAAHHLAESHHVSLYDSRACVGGVWALQPEQGQAYDWLETNTPRQLFAYPGFPLTNDDAEGGKSNRPSAYITAQTARRYYARFAKEMRLNDSEGGGRLAKLELSTRVVKLRRCSQGQSGSDASGGGRNILEDCRWCLETEQGAVHHYHRVVLALGAFSTPSMPTVLSELRRTGVRVLHSSQLAQASSCELLERAHRVIVVGSGKSALDVVAKAGQSKELLLIGGAMDVWPLPSGTWPAWTSRLPLVSRLSPWSGSPRQSYSETMMRFFWGQMAKSSFVLQNSESKGVGDDGERGWEQIMRSSARIFPSPRELKNTTCRVVHARCGAFAELERGKFALLGTRSCEQEEEIITEVDQQKDVIVACTGYSRADVAMRELLGPHLADELGLGGQGDREWTLALNEALEEARRCVPVLSHLHHVSPMQETIRLYRHMVPLDHSKRDFAVLGLPQTLSAAIVAEVQARWLEAYFQGRMPQRNSSRRDIVKSTASMVAASLARYGTADARMGTNMSLELAWYADVICKDVDGRERSGKRWSLRPLNSHEWSQERENIT